MEQIRGTAKLQNTNCIIRQTCIPGCEVYLDVDEHHDAGRDVEGAEGGVQHIAHLFTHL